MAELTSELGRLLLDVGPWLVFLIVSAETAVFLGLLVPAEATVLLAAFLADRGLLPLDQVVAATLVGALLGDQIGYWLGRTGGRRVAGRGGRIGRLWARYEPATRRLFGRRAAISVTLARFISFVRTLMPWFAGMSRMSYPRFLIYDVLGVLGWGVGSIMLGIALGESWHLADEWLGTAGAVLVLAALLAAAVVALRRRRRVAEEAELDAWTASLLELAGADEPAAHDRRRAVLRVGLTGNIASGKSSVARVWQRLGASVVDADVLARNAVAPGSPGLAAVVEAFGRGVLAPDGTLDRAALRARVFEDAAARRRLEAIVHPEVDRLRRQEEARLREAGADVVVHDIPLLFEAGLADRVDVVVLVEAPEPVRLERLVRERGLDEAEARRMIAAQMPSEAKRERADHVIRNDGTLAELEEQAERVWTELKRAARSD